MLTIPFNEFTARAQEIRDALARREEVLLVEEGQPVGRLTAEQEHGLAEAADQELGADPNWMNDPAIGMWADREDMADPTEWVRQLRSKRRYDV